jgi:xanthine/uracil permease
MLIAPLASKLLRFFPPVVTGTIIPVIAVGLMRIGINRIVGMVAATGILSAVDLRGNRNGPSVVAVGLGFGMIPLVAANFKQWLPHSSHPPVEPGILLATMAADVLNAFL